MSTIILFFQGGIGNYGSIILPLLLLGVFYFILIRPQQKRHRDLQEIISNLKAGDRVVTTGGIIGTITQVRDMSLLIRSADKTILEVARSAVAGLDTTEEKK